MLVRFKIKDHFEDWTLGSVPRLGDQIELPGYREGRVTSVVWKLSDDNGFIRKDPRITVYLK